MANASTRAVHDRDQSAEVSDVAEPVDL